MGCLRIKANKCGYKEKDRRLKEQFIYCKNNNDDNGGDMLSVIVDSNQKKK